MLTRVHVKGFKSLVDVEVELKPLTVLLGPNASGKSNLLEALAVLAELGSGGKLQGAFAPPNRGKPLECFSFGEDGVRGLLEQEAIRFSIEADLHLSDAVVNEVNRQVHEMEPPKRRARHPAGSARSGKGRSKDSPNGDSPVRHRNLRYRIEVEMLPRQGILRMADEYLAALNKRGEPTSRRRPFIERARDGLLRLRFERGALARHCGCHLDHSVLSMRHYPPHHPHVVAASYELANWLFYSFEPRERMRVPAPLREVRRIGGMGEELPAFLNTLKETAPSQFRRIQERLASLVPGVEAIEAGVNSSGEVEVNLRERGAWRPSHLISDGTLRMLALASLTGIDPKPGLIGLEEPETGVHPRRIRRIAEFLNRETTTGDTQYMVTSHSPTLPDWVDQEAIRVVRSERGKTRIDPCESNVPRRT